MATLRMRTAPVRAFIVRLTEEERSALVAYATREDLRLSQVVRRWIREHADEGTQLGPEQPR